MTNLYVLTSVKFAEVLERSTIGVVHNSFRESNSKGLFSMSFPPYAKVSLRLLHENAVISCKAIIKSSNAVTLSSAITELEPAQQVVLALIYFEGFKIKDIASILNLSASEVIRLHAMAAFALCKTIANDRVDPHRRTQDQRESLARV